MGEIVKFPSPRARAGPKKPRRFTGRDTIKYHTADQIRALRRTVRNQADLHEARGNITAIREWAAIDILTSAGLRASEVANLRCGDCSIGYGKSALFVREGKWGKSRLVQVPQQLRLHLRKYLAWKGRRGEPIGADDHLFQGQRGPWTPQAVSQIVKKWLRQLGLYERGKSAHSLRHSYATEHYRKNRCLRGLQKQLGHSDVSTTTIYADITEEDLLGQVRNLWGR